MKIKLHKATLRRYSLLRRYWFLLVCIVIGSLTMFFKVHTDINRKEVATKSPEPTAQTTNPLCGLTYINQSDFIIQDRMIKMDEVSSFKQIESGNIPLIVASDSDSVDNRMYSPKLQKIIVLETQTDSQNMVTDKVNLYDLKTNESKTIYEMKEIPFEGSEYRKQITGVSFSDDSSMIAITTGESLFIYHIDTDRIETLFDDKTTNRWRGIGGIWSYTVPFNWPVDNKIVLQEGYYEGSGYSIYDLKTHKKTPTNYQLYHFGQQILGFYKGNMIVADRGPFNDEPSDGPLTRIYLVDVDTLSQKLLLNVNGDLGFSYITNDGVLYFDKLNTEYIPSYYCKGDEVLQSQSTFTTLMKLDLQTKLVKQLLRADAARTLNAPSKDMSIEGIIANNDVTNRKILLQMRWGDAVIKFLLNENDPKILTQIK